MNPEIKKLLTDFFDKYDKLFNDGTISCTVIDQHRFREDISDLTHKVQMLQMEHDYKRVFEQMEGE